WRRDDARICSDVEAKCFGPRGRFIKARADARERSGGRGRLPIGGDVAMKLPYYLLDVFTRDRLSGNPLAVVLKADELSSARMQAIAAEFNLSETVFVLSPKN